MKKKISLVLASLLAIFYVYFLQITFDKSSLKNLNDGKIIVIGHGGLGFAAWMPFNPYPANGMTALEKAIVEKKADGVEVDIHMTKDDEFVLYHDEKLDSKTDLTGCIEEMPLKEVLKANYVLGAPFDWFQNDQLASLDDLINLLKKQKEIPHLQLDVRSSSKCKSKEENGKWEKRMAIKLVEKLAKSGIPAEKILIVTIKRGFIYELYKSNNPFPTSYELLTGDEEEIEFTKKNNIRSVTIKPRLLSKEISKKYHDNGVQVVTFGAKSKSGNKKLLEANPDVIQTNNIEALQELLDIE